MTEVPVRDAPEAGPSRTATVTAVVTGGGTSGHVLPALALLESLEAFGVAADRLGFVGTSRGADEALVEASGLAGRGLHREYLPMSGLQRGLGLGALRRNLPLPWRLAVSRVRAGRLVRRWAPAVVVSVGGHASEPMVRAARAAGVPVVCVSYDAVPGLATRRQARRSTANAIAFAGIDLPRATITGAPVRAVVLELADRLGAPASPTPESGAVVRGIRESFGFRTEFVICVTGGSLGSGVLNSAIPGLVEALARRLPGRCTVFHVCGERNLGDPAPQVPTGVDYVRVGYEPRLAELHAASDLVVCRAGASTVAEVATLGRAAVVVPWAASADGHQKRNAEWLGGSGGAVVLDEAQAGAGVLAETVVDLLEEPDRRRRIAQAAHRLGADARSGALRRLVLEVAGLVHPPTVSLDGVRRIHVVGAGGPGMSALAHLLADMGHRVTGSDTVDNAAAARLRARGVDVAVGHDPAAVHGCDIVTYSTGVPVDNIELRRAREEGAAVVHRAAVLTAACARTRAVGVLGTHGKTTTASLLAAMLIEGGASPSWLVGGDVSSLGETASWSGEGVLVVEADESDGTHEALPLWGAVLTNVDEDHMDRYPTMDDLDASFARVLDRCDGPIIMCADDPGCVRVWHRLAPRTRDRVTWWGRESTETPGGARPGLVRGESRADASGITFDVSFSIGDGGRMHDEPTARRQVFHPVHGEHNASNVAGALLAARMLGVSAESAIAAAGTFSGVLRRLEHRGSAGGVDVIDDYAHVPGEIRAAIAAVGQRHPGRRVVAVFQPNRYHRVRDMHASYAGCFDGAAIAVICDIYASGTAPIPGVTGRLVADAVRNAAGPAGPEVRWAPTRADVLEALSEILRPGDVCLGMGCGDIGGLPEQILPVLASRPDPDGGARS